MDNGNISDERMPIYDMSYSLYESIISRNSTDTKKEIICCIIDNCLSFYKEFYPGIRYLALLAARWEMLLKYMGGHLVISINENSPMGYIDIYLRRCTINSTDLEYFGTLAKESGSYVSLETVHVDFFGDGDICLHFLISVPLKNKTNV